MMRAAWSRKISDAFMTNLQHCVLSPLLARVKEDDTLMLALRGEYISIYYRGGSLFQISGTPPDSRAPYTIKFDDNYRRGYQSPPLDFPREVRTCEEAARLVDAIPNLKYVMDRFFSKHSKPEREFQQLVVRENNFSSISNESEYFIVDIELALDEPHAKFDMLAVRWLHNERNQMDRLVPTLIEMKYGTEALEGPSGLIKHLQDAYQFRKSEDWNGLCSGIEGHLNQLKQLRLLRFNQSDRVPELRLDPKSTCPELIFLLANYNPRSTRILDVLDQVNSYLRKVDGDSAKKLFDVRFFQASFAGYGLHHASMLKPTDFERQVRCLRDASRSAPA